ncbi:hypothetical protein TNCV_3749981 [Trichonephila clavipes]|nr:hypothetical protein TNCV_3749981 [Trichonephila clavipes]
MVQRSREKEQLQLHIHGTENILLKGCTSTGVSNYDQKSSRQTDHLTGTTAHAPRGLRSRCWPGIDLNQSGDRNGRKLGVSRDPEAPPIHHWRTVCGRSRSRCRNCGGGDGGRVAIYRPFGELRRAKIVLSPVWCSRPTTGVPLAHATMNFVGLDLTASDSDYSQSVIRFAVSDDRQSLEEEGEDEETSHTCHSCKLNFENLSEYLEHLNDDCMTDAKEVGCYDDASLAALPRDMFIRSSPKGLKKGVRNYSSVRSLYTPFFSDKLLRQTRMFYSFALLRTTPFAHPHPIIFGVGCLQNCGTLSLVSSFHAEIVEVEIGGVAIYRPFGEFRRAKPYCHMYGAQGQRQAYL